MKKLQIGSWKDKNTMNRVATYHSGCDSGCTSKLSEQKVGVWVAPRKIFKAKPPRTLGNAPLQDRIKIAFVIDFTFWKSFSSLNSLQTTNEKEES